MFRLARIISRTVLTGLLLQAPSSVWAEVAGVCPGAEEMKVNTAVRGPDAAPGVRDCYRISVTSPGVMTLDASDLGRSGTGPRLAFLGKDPADSSQAGRYRIVRRTPRSTIVRVVVPGSFLLSVTGEDPTRPLPGYTLRDAFVSDAAASGGDPLCPPGKDVEGDDHDPIELSALELGVRLLALCDVSWRDDHGDTPLCATPLPLGESVSGRIDGAEGDDEDFFTFVLDELRTVEAEVLGDAEAYPVTLYDDDGLRLDVTATGRLVRTLPPGRYHLRLLPPPLDSSWGDSYVLSLRALDEP